MEKAAVCDRRFFLLHLLSQHLASNVSAMSALGRRRTFSYVRLAFNVTPEAMIILSLCRWRFCRLSQARATQSLHWQPVCKHQSRPQTKMLFDASFGQTSILGCLSFPSSRL
jgi:hypothetical protein